MPSKKTLALLAAGTLAIATWAGYRAECRVMDSAGNKPITFQSVVRRVTAPKSRTGQIDKLNALRHRAGRMAPSPGEAAAAWKIIRAMTVEDLKAYLEEIPMEPRRGVNEVMLCMLFSRWGQLDPEAAVEVASQPPYKDRDPLMLAVATAWADRDPVAALRWADKLGPGAVQGTAASAVGKMLLQENPATALERAIAEFPAAVNAVASALATRPGESEESRRAILQRLAGLSNNGQALASFLRGMASPSRQDPGISESLLAEIDRCGLPENRIAEIKSMLNSYLTRYSPPDRQIGAPGADSTQPMAYYHYLQWTDREPDKAIAWAEQNGRADLLANRVKQQTMDLLRSTWQPGVRQQTRDPMAKGVVKQYQGWERLDPAAAETWLKTMPADMRKHLSPSSGDATR